MRVLCGRIDAKCTVHSVDRFSFFRNFSRHDDLKQMLDSNKDHLKLEAMKRIIGMVAKVCAAGER